MVSHDHGVLIHQHVGRGCGIQSARTEHEPPTERLSIGGHRRRSIPDGVLAEEAGRQTAVLDTARTRVSISSFTKQGSLISPSRALAERKFGAAPSGNRSLTSRWARVQSPVPRSRGQSDSLQRTRYKITEPPKKVKEKGAQHLSCYGVEFPERHEAAERDGLGHRKNFRRSPIGYSTMGPRSQTALAGAWASILTLWSWVPPDHHISLHGRCATASRSPSPRSSPGLEGRPGCVSADGPLCLLSWRLRDRVTFTKRDGAASYDLQSRIRIMADEITRAPDILARS